MGIQTPAELTPPKVSLVGHDSNAFAIMDTVVRALKREGNPREVIEAFREEAMSGDYDHLLATALAYTELDTEGL
jgi:hypothetical protein